MEKVKKDTMMRISTVLSDKLQDIKTETGIPKKIILEKAVRKMFPEYFEEVK